MRSSLALACGGSLALAVRSSLALACGGSLALAVRSDLRPRASIIGCKVFEIVALDHVQLAMPAGQESAARAFYVDVLGLVEDTKPANLAVRGGVWFRSGALRLHLGVDPNFTAARKAHPAILVRGLSELATKCRTAGFPPVTDEPLEGFNRIYVFDPFGNRIELLEPATGGYSPDSTP